MTTHTACIKFARAFDPQRIIDGPPQGEPTMFDRAGLTFLPGTRTIPLVVDHDLERQIGEVHEIVRWGWTDGEWLVARCSISDPMPPWLKKGTRASFSSRKLHSHDLHGWTHVTRALMEEVSVLLSQRPVEQCAEVLLLEHSSSPTGASDRAAAGDTYRREPGLNPGDIVFYGSGRELWDNARRGEAPAGEEIHTPRVLVRRTYPAVFTLR